ncbi:MAG: hypothetical protein LUI12_04030 [Clostridiales bacterium]|nr:hypothetical protein [Clostridiales bacterium]
MEQETVIYYYPVKESQEGMPAAAKRHWWQEGGLSPFRLLEIQEGAHRTIGSQTPDGRDALQLYACPVPPFYYRKKSWKPWQLCKAMEKALYQIEGMTDVLAALEIEKLLPEEMRGRWRPRMETVRKLTALLLAKEAGQSLCQKAAVKLGKPEDMEWQMEMTWELLQPYLSRINQCVIRYPPAPEFDMREELAGYLDDYYYEYGLVVQTEAYGRGNGRAEAGRGQIEQGCLCLDFREDHLYRAIRKYLDTVLKNRYY